LNNPDLKTLLDRLTGAYAGSYLRLDPLEIVRRYGDSEDREVAGFIAAALALGRADLIRRATSDVLDAMGPSPSRFVRRYDPVRHAAAFRGFVYRFFGEADIHLLVHRLHRVLAEHGSVGG